MKAVTLILLSVVLMALAFAGLAIRILLKKGGKFPNTHVSGNKYLKRNGVYCSQTQDRLEQARVKKKLSFSDVSFVPGKEVQ